MQTPAADKSKPAKDYTAWPHFVFSRKLIALSFGHHERGPIRQVVGVWFLPPFPNHRFGTALGGIYDRAAPSKAGG